jgi:hypothetical protein
MLDTRRCTTGIEKKKRSGLGAKARKQAACARAALAM